MRAKLGTGAKRRIHRQFVPRTMGPFAVTESKYFDSHLNATAIAEGTAWTATELDPATLLTLCVPSEGSDIDNRIGRRIEVYKIALRGVIRVTVLQDQADMIPPPAYRLILYLDQQSNGTQSQGEELMGAPGAASAALTFNTFQNLANLGRFRVLRDITLRSHVSTAVTDGANTSSQIIADIPFKMTVRFRQPISMKFNASNGGTIGDIVDNSFHLIGQKSSTAFESALSYQCRTYYKDK